MPSPRAAHAAALAHLIGLQHPDGGWEGEMVWNTMLLSQYVIVHRIVGRAISPEDARAQMIQHYEVTRTPEGGWGMHGERRAVRLHHRAGVRGAAAARLPPDEIRWWRRRAAVSAAAARGRRASQSRPGASSGWRCSGCTSYEGVNPIPPELFLLPEWLPLHPDNYYCHTRYIYLGIAYLYGRRFRADLGPITRRAAPRTIRPPNTTRSISRRTATTSRRAICTCGRARRCAPPTTRSHSYEKRPLRRAAASARWRTASSASSTSRRPAATRGCRRSTGCSNCLALFAERHPLIPTGRRLAAMEAWKWEDEAEGMRYARRALDPWDTAFAHARAARGAGPRRRRDGARRRCGDAYGWLRDAQMQTELPPGTSAERREPIVGGWCFSDGQHRWPVSDCTAEALTALCRRARGRTGSSPIGERIADARLEAAARFILRRQNADGGFGTYERRRGSAFLEAHQPLGDVRQLHDRALVHRVHRVVRGRAGALSRALPGRRCATSIERAIARGVALLALAPARRRLVPRLLGRQLHLRHLPRRRGRCAPPACAATIRRSRAPSSGCCDKQKRRRRLGRALEELPDRRATSSTPRARRR